MSWNDNTWLYGYKIRQQELADRIGKESRVLRFWASQKREPDDQSYDLLAAALLADTLNINDDGAIRRRTLVVAGEDPWPYETRMAIEAEARVLRERFAAFKALRLLFERWEAAGKPVLESDSDFSLAFNDLPGIRPPADASRQSKCRLLAVLVVARHLGAAFEPGLSGTEIARMINFEKFSELGDAVNISEVKIQQSESVSTTQYALVRESLQACENEQLAGFLCRDFDCANADALCDRIVDCRAPSGVQTRNRLKASIVLLANRAKDYQALDALRQLIYSVGVVNAVPVVDNDGLSALGEVEDPGPVCLLRLSIDGYLLGQNKVRAEHFADRHYLHAESKLKLFNRAPNSGRIPDVYKCTSLDYRLWRVAKCLDPEVVKAESVPIPDSDENRAAMYEYLERFNSSIESSNETGDHYLLCAPETESVEFLSHLKEHLKSLRVFQTTKNSGIPLFGVKVVDMHVWLAETLYACQKREEYLQGIEALKNSAKPNQEMEKMGEPTEHQQINNYGTMIGGSISRDGIVVNNASLSPEDIQRLLQHALDETDGSDDHHKPLRKIVRELQTAIEDGKVPDAAKLDNALKVATISEKTAKIFHTLVGVLANFAAGDGGNSAS